MTRNQLELRHCIYRALLMAAGRRIDGGDVQTLYEHASVVYERDRTSGKSHPGALQNALTYITDAVIFRDMIAKYNC